MLAAFVTFTREEWAHLRDTSPLPLTEADLSVVHGINDQVPLSEVAEVYLPLARLLNLYVVNVRDLHRVTGEFLSGTSAAAGTDLFSSETELQDWRRPVPYVIGVAGGVASGKSTTARILQALLSRWPDHPRVELITTDGFLYPNEELQARGLLANKGFPASYDQRRLVRFLADLKSGREEVTAPVYSHETYDVVPGEVVRLQRPDILIIEGLNILQAGGSSPHLFVSDLLDFSLYVDAGEADIERWYIDRFLSLVAAARHTSSFYHRFAGMSDAQVANLARQVWRDVNGVNLRENIAPTRLRAHLILEKGSDHAVHRIRLRKL
jgi:type I pantothenate kinase